MIIIITDFKATGITYIIHVNFIVILNTFIIDKNIASKICKNYVMYVIE